MVVHCALLSYFERIVAGDRKHPTLIEERDVTSSMEQGLPDSKAVLSSSSAEVTISRLSSDRGKAGAKPQEVIFYNAERS